MVEGSGTATRKPFKFDEAELIAALSKSPVRLWALAHITPPAIVIAITAIIFIFIKCCLTIGIFQYINKEEFSNKRCKHKFARRCQVSGRHFT